ncbi:unnamed protein product [Spirodela intermedia]|uniref:PHD-type zinc finger plants domain-containing protein n=1 Tax=Spirodela intermedia TaxID=51605 RepID=A0A7I8LGH3_SPIIN|nr:unnamed protein product [Spirodela intermedia]
MEEAPAPIVGGDEGKSFFCSLCGDVGFREALLPCRARGCSRLQHTYCGRYCPEMMDDAGRWRCEWCAWKVSSDRLGEDEESGRKRARRVLPFSSSPEMIKQASPERPIDKDRSRESSVTAGREHPPPACTSGPGNTSIINASVEITNVTHKHVGANDRGSSSRALDRWRNLAKRTRLGGKKYKLLADVLCFPGRERTSTTPTA